MVPGAVRNPTLTVNGETVSFPVEIPSGGRLELDGTGGCTLYGPKGETLRYILGLLEISIPEVSDEEEDDGF